MGELEQRKKDLLKHFKTKPTYLVYVVFGLIAIFGYYIRTRNLSLLKDVTTGQYIPLALDPFAFLRYAQYILQNGHLMAVDALRYYPLGYSMLSEFRLLSYFVVYLYKFFHFFNPSVTLEYVHVLYPVICFVLGLIFFFLLVRKLFNWKIALLSSAFLTVLPTYLYRTMAGFSDKESLAMVFMFATLYFYVGAWKTGNLKKSVGFGILAGFSTGLLGLVWGGVNFMYLTIGSFALIGGALNIFSRKDFYVYACWMLTLIPVLMIGYPGKFTIGSFITSFTWEVMIFGFLVGLINLLLFDLDLLKIKDKVRDKLPFGVVSLCVAAFFGVVILTVLYKPTFLFDKLKDLLIDFTRPFGRSRWALTVAESHQPFFKDWIGQMNWKYILLFMFGSVLLFYETIKPIKKKVLALTLMYVGFIFAFSMSRYSPQSVFNGETTISQLLYIGSFVLFVLIIFAAYLNVFYNDKQTFKLIKSLNKNAIFVFVFFIFMVVAARSAVRLLFVFSPATAIMASYFTVTTLKKIKMLKEDVYKIVAYILIFLVVGTSLFGFSKIVMAQGKHTGPSYNHQWQVGMNWVRENTQEDAVFAHWWDYGYWVQTGGHRATLSDGGNARGAINHFIGRHVLTGQSETEALELLKANNATHLLIIKDEIGKYPAFSSIGADENYDRYSWISTFVMDTNQIQETRNETIYLYRGGTALDDDFIYQDRVFPAGSTGIGGFLVPVQNVEAKEGNETKTVQKINQPTAVLFYNGQQVNIPLECIFVNGQELTFETEGLPGCLRIIPTIEPGGRTNIMGAGLYLSGDVRKSLFTQLFLFNKESEYFKLAYSDEEEGMPLALYQGMLIGPLKIWEISYPDNLNVPPEYYGTVLPNPKVTEVRR